MLVELILSLATQAGLLLSFGGVFAVILVRDAQPLQNKFVFSLLRGWIFFPVAIFSLAKIDFISKYTILQAALVLNLAAYLCFRKRPEFLNHYQGCLPKGGTYLYWSFLTGWNSFLARPSLRSRRPKNFLRD